MFIVNSNVFFVQGWLEKQAQKIVDATTKVRST